MKNPLIISLGCAFVWSLWPILAKYSKMSAPQISTIVAISSVIFVVFIFLFQNQLSVEGSTKKGVSILIVAGFLNAIGMILYGILLNKDNNFTLSTYLPILWALMQVLAVLLPVIIFKENVSVQKIGCIAGIIILVFFLNKS